MVGQLTCVNKKELTNTNVLGQRPPKGPVRVLWLDKSYKYGGPKADIYKYLTPEEKPGIVRINTLFSLFRQEKKEILDANPGSGHPKSD